MKNIAKLRAGEAVFSALYETAVGIDVHEKRWLPVIKAHVSVTMSLRPSIGISERCSNSLKN